MRYPSYRVGRQRILVAEPGEKAWAGQRFGDGRVKRMVLCFGSIGVDYVLSYSPTLEEALEKSAATLKEYGLESHFTEPEMEDGSTHDCPDAENYPCTCDLTYTESGYIASWEWNIVNEDATRDDLIKLHRRES
jgi:hypothetical protein